MMRRLGERKYLALLAVMVVIAILEPLSFAWPQSAQIIGGAIVLVINIAVLLVVFEARWERGLAFFLLASLISANIMREVVSDQRQIGAIVFHSLATVFLALAV